MCAFITPVSDLVLACTIINQANQTLHYIACLLLTLCTFVLSCLAQSSRDGLVARMEANGFSLIKEDAIPFLIREHARKFQWSVAQATRWVRQ